MKNSAVDYKDFMLEKSSRELENIEWSISYSFNARDEKSKRVLLIGDSICNGYQPVVREILGKRLNVTYWISSKCVTDMRYLKELDFYLDAHEYDLILFNNGCHSTDKFPEEREIAYKKAVEFITKKCCDIPLVLVLCAPLKLKNDDEKIRGFNEYTKKVADEFGLPVIDLYTPLLVLDRETAMFDEYHWNEEGRTMQGEIIADYIEQAMELSDELISQASSKMGPSGPVK